MMEKHDIRESIEEMIEESYLLGLNESEIKADLDRFVESCGKVIRQNVHDRKQMQILADKLARARALSLIEDHQHQPDGEELLAEEDAEKPPRRRFAERVARNKRLILRTIAECDPKLVERIERERFPVQPPDLPPVFPVDAEQPQKAKSLLMKICYASILLFGLLLVYLVLLQQNF